MSTQSHYDLLGIQPEADADEVRRAYRAMARVLHPDVNQEHDAAQRFARVAHAYSVLSDPIRRGHYDEQRRLDAATVGATGRPGPLPTNGNGVGRGALRGADVEVEVVLSLREAAFGVERTLEVTRREVCAICVGVGVTPGGSVRRCERCLGTGGARAPGEECAPCRGSGVIADPPCPNCRGAGRRQGRTSMTVSIPSGIDDGQVLRLKGDGDGGPRNGPRGDLLLHLFVEPDPVLRRHGADILMDLSVNPEEARRGMTLEVPTLRGPKQLRIPAGARDRAVLRLGGAGLRLGSWRRGDQFVTLHISEKVVAEVALDYSSSP